MDEPEGFREFVVAHQRRLLRTAWLLCGDWATAEDLVQSALAAVWPRWSGIGPAEAMRVAYVHRVLATRSIRARRPRASEFLTPDVPEPRQPAEPAETALALARRDLVMALANLPPRQRTALVLRYFVDLTEADTAAAMGCSVGAVKSHTHKAISRLRTMPHLIADHIEETS